MSKISPDSITVLDEIRPLSFGVLKYFLLLLGGAGAGRGGGGGGGGGGCGVNPFVIMVRQ